MHAAAGRLIVDILIKNIEGLISWYSHTDKFMNSHVHKKNGDHTYNIHISYFAFIMGYMQLNVLYDSSWNTNEIIHTQIQSGNVVIVT